MGRQARVVTPVFPDGMSVKASIAYAKGTNESTNLPINSVEPLNGIIGLDYTATNGKWGGSLALTAADAQDRLDETNGDLLEPTGYGVIDVYGFWRPTQDTRVRLGAFNVTDRQFTRSIDVQGIPANTLEPGRFQQPGINISAMFDWAL